MNLEYLKTLAGVWEGNSRTWFKPGELEDESTVKGTITPILGGRYMRHDYIGSMKGKPRHGEETIGFNTASQHFEISWIDTFHTGTLILFSTGAATPRGFTVQGNYDIAPDTPPWAWKTVFDLIDNDHLTISAYNIIPGKQESLAIETKYTRVTP